MNRRFIFCLLLFVSGFVCSCFAQQKTIDVLYLKNGSIIKGLIQELVPNEKVKIATSDGSLFVYQMDEVEKVLKEAVVEEQIFEDEEDVVRTYPGRERIKTTAKSYREPMIAFLGSFFIPGIGQIYNGQLSRGIGMFGWSAGSYVLFGLGYYMLAVGASDGAALLALGGMLSAAVCWVYSMVDGVMVANKINEQLGYAQVRLGEKSTLSLRPKLERQLLPGGALTMKNTSTVGLSLQLNF